MRLSFLLSATALLAFTLPAAAIGPTTAAPYESNPGFQKARQEAMEMARRRNLHFTVDAWRKANKIAGGHCMECYRGMIDAATSMGEAKDAAKFAVEMESGAETPFDKSTAELYQGRALQQQAGLDKPKPALLEQSHAALVKALETDPENLGCNYLDGIALARLGRDAEATAAFQNYVAHARKNDALAIRARHFAENPELARHKTAPPIVVTTLSGKRFNLDEMNGRVVLIDFWATWCGPCNAELPHMQKLAQKYANDPFEVISVSWDADETKWKDFIAAYNMTWNQYRDTDHSLSTSFSVDAIPHYFTIDSDGVLTAENVGSGSMADSRIDKLVRRARESMRPQQPVAAVDRQAAPGQ